jgi:hypothetical protein
VLFAVAACDRSTPTDAEAWIDDALGAPAAAIPLAVFPTQVTARQHVGTIGMPFGFDFTVPALTCGGGVPSAPWVWTVDKAIAQLELPQGLGGTDEENLSLGFDNFDEPRFCTVGAACPFALSDGLWRAYQIAPGGAVRREVQLGYAMADLYTFLGPYKPVIGAFLPAGTCIPAGDHLRFVYRGHVPGRATAWTDAPFTAHFRHRSFGFGGPTAWTTLDDDDVQPLTIVADGARFVRALAPLDVAVDEDFTIAVVVTDRYGNPSPIDGIVSLSGDVAAEVVFADAWRVEVPARYDTAGAHRVVPSLPGARAVWHWTVAWDGEPPVRRVLGDVHAHTGDGGAQRKFIGTFAPGDHRALYTRTWDALRYMREVAGLDFGAVSEHAVRWDGWSPPPAVMNDPAFTAPGGACVGDEVEIPNIVGWWSRQQLIVDLYQSTVEDRFVAYPAYEWHAHHTAAADKSMLHRVVLFRDFSPAPYLDPLPLLPGDVDDIPPQCIVRFLELAGFRDRALVVPHMMTSDDRNIDWDLTYDTSSMPPVATLEQTEAYYRVGEIYSARSIDQARPAGKPTLTVFEGADAGAPEPWSFRHGWQARGARIGVIGSSDNHSQTPGVNDDFDLAGASFHTNEPGGYAVALATTADRAGIYDALARRASYATSGVRAWLDVTVAGSPMGTELTSSAPSTTVTIDLLAGMPISAVELWAAPVGAAGTGYQRIATPTAGGETYSAAVTIDNPVVPGGAPEAWLYYVRAFLDAPGGGGSEDEAVWSSPVWITWTGG